MRSIHRSLIATLGVSILGVAAACGSSSNGNTGSNLGTDSGANDSSTPESGGGGEDSGRQADATSHDGASDAAPTTDAGDGGLLGANCPAVDAGNPFVEAQHGPFPTVI